MTKFKPIKLKWVAKHENKTVKHPNYADIDRDTLLEFTLYDQKKFLGIPYKKVPIFTMKKGPGRFNLFVRLRTYNMKLYDHTGTKLWIVGNSNPLHFYTIAENETREHHSWGNIPYQPVSLKDYEK